MSTGLYIPGRQIIEVSLPEAAASADLKVRPHPTSPGNMEPNVLAFTVGILTFIKTLLAIWGKYFYPHFKDEATNMQNS